MTVRQGFMVEGRSDYEAAFRFAAENGFEFVELNAEHAFERRRVDAAAVRRAAAEHGLDLVVHLPYRLDPGSPHEHVREGAIRELRAAVDAAVELGAEKGVFHAETKSHAAAWPATELREALYDTVRRVGDHARDRGFEACVENLKSPAFDAGDFPDLFGATEAAACLDTGHAFVTGQDAAAQADLLRAHGDRISHVHLNETRQEDDDEHLPVGMGRIDFGAIAAALRDVDWSGTCTHEIFSYGFEYAAPSKDAFDDHLAGA